MPMFDGQLARDDSGPTVVTIFQQFEDIPPMFIAQRGQRPVIENHDIGLRERGHEFAVASVPFRHRQLGQQPRETEIERTPAFSARLLGEGTGEPGFADPGGTRNQDIVMLTDPLARG